MNLDIIPSYVNFSAKAQERDRNKLTGLMHQIVSKKII